MAYQTFPWVKGDSRSYNKLLALHLPHLKGKSFMDVGCNEGYFCGYADFSGAAKVVGIDINPQFLAVAQALFPDCEFLCQSWDNLPDEKWDIILNASAIHYAKDQKQFLDQLMSRLKPDGTLILEIGVAPGPGNEFVEVKRSIDTRLFPTQLKLEEMLDGYAWKHISSSARQTGDPIPRIVYHIAHKLPYAILALDDPHAGKTFTIRQIFKPDIKRIFGDRLYYDIARGQLEAPESILAVVKRNQKTMDCGKITWEICRDKLLPEFCSWLKRTLPSEDFILDMFVPASFRQKFAQIIEEAGYYVVNMQLQKAISRPRAKEMAPKDSAWRYHKHLQEEFMINEADYLAANPDVAQALKEGKIYSALAHYIFHGRKEGRKRKPESEK